MLGCSASSCCLLRRSRCRKPLAHMAVAAWSSPVGMRTGGATVPDCLAGTAAQAALALSSKRPAAATQVGTPQVRTGTGARCARQLQPQLCHVIWQLAPLLQQLRRTSGLWQQRAQLLLHGCGASVVVWAYEGWCCAGDNSGQKSVSRLQQVLSQCCMLCLLCLLTALSRATAAVLGRSLLVAAGAAHGRQMFSCRARAVGHVADDQPTQLQALVSHDASGRVGGRALLHHCLHQAARDCPDRHQWL